MIEPKSIILFHRKNMEWYNKLFVPYMREKYRARITIICNEEVESFSKRSWCNNDDVIIIVKDPGKLK